MSEKIQTIYRVIKNKDFVILDKTALLDPRLSWKAKGIHSYMMAQKDDWIFHRDVMLQFCKDGKDSLKAGLKELQKYGYVDISPEKEHGVIIKWITTVYERPQVCAQACVQPVNSRSGKAASGQKMQNLANTGVVADISRSGFSTCGKPASNKINHNNIKNNNNLGRQLSVDNSEQLPTECMPTTEKILKKETDLKDKQKFFKRAETKTGRMSDREEHARRQLLARQFEKLTGVKAIMTGGTYVCQDT